MSRSGNLASLLQTIFAARMLYSVNHLTVRGYEKGRYRMSEAVQKKPDTIQMRVGGMDCANCALTLERSIAGITGVEQVEVSFATTRLVVQGAASLEAVAERVRAMGYQPLPLEESPDAAAQAETRGGVGGFVRFMLSARPTAVAAGGALALIVAFAAQTVGILSETSPILLGVHVVVTLVAGGPIAWKGLRALLRGRQVTIDLLMGIAAAGALLIGETGEAAVVIVLFAIGEALEGYSAERARSSLRSLLALRPDEATVLRQCIDCEEHLGQDGYTGGPCPFCGAHETRVPVAYVLVGDTVIVRPGERIPVDGRVVRGTSDVNQAPITGESVPVTRGPDDEVFAGTINGAGALEIETARAAGDSTISQIVRLVEEAQSRRSPAERFIDRFARWYTPAVVALAALLAVVPPLFFGAPFFDLPDGTHGWLYRALALLIVACPCALVISTPVTVVSTLSALAWRGVLVKGGASLDALARVRAFAFDKTGTLTEGHPGVVQVITKTCHHNGGGCADCDDLLALAASVERRSEHPLAQAIVHAALERGVKERYPAAADVHVLAGRGVQGRVAEGTVTIGSHAYYHSEFSEHGPLHPHIVAAEDAGQTTVLVWQDGRALGFIGVADQPRGSSAAALQRLRSTGSSTRTVMLTGDHARVAKAVAAQVGGIDEVHAGDDAT